jgi:HSP20 family protein
MTTLTEPYAPWLRELNRLFTPEGAMAGFIPPADVIVDDDGVTVHMDVPGLSAESLDIELDNDVLTVRGERRPPYPMEDGQPGVRRVERRFGKFERSLRVPRGLDPNAIDASLVDGVLTLRIPQPAKPEPHHVRIKTSSSQQREMQGSAA